MARDPVRPNELQAGQEVGVYVEYYERPARHRVATFVVRDPPPQSPDRATRTLKQLNAQSDTRPAAFGVVAGFIGLALGAVDGLVCRLPRRALVAGASAWWWACSAGSSPASSPTWSTRRSPACHEADVRDGHLHGWRLRSADGGTQPGVGLAGMTMGLGQGVALRSGRLLLFGFLGGAVGGLLGGVLFDPWTCCCSRRSSRART